MNVSLVSLLLLTALAVGSPSVLADSIDDVPAGFLKPSTGGLPTNAWGGTSLGTTKRLVAALPAAPRSRALRDLQFRVMVPSAGAYADPGIATMTSNALMMSGEPASACAVVPRHDLMQTFAARALAACQSFAGDSAGALAAAPDLRASDPQLAVLLQSAASGKPTAGVPAGPLDGPAMVMFALARVRPPAAALQSNDPPMIRAVVADRSLPIVTRVEAGERGEASAIIEATRLSDLYGPGGA